MGNCEKLFQKLKNNPNDATFAQIEKLLLQENFILDRITGSHHVLKGFGNFCDSRPQEQSEICLRKESD